jgi:hypothetical protein
MISCQGEPRLGWTRAPVLESGAVLRDVLSSILRQAGMTRDEFMGLL